MYSTTDIAELELLKLLNDANVPHFLYHQILEWGHKSNLNGYNFEPIWIHQDAAISYLEHLHGLSYCHPIKTPITFEDDNLTVEVILFDFARTSKGPKPPPKRKELSSVAVRVQQNKTQR